MHAIVTLLNAENYAQMEALWRELEFECGLTGIAVTPIPHISWHIAAEYDFKRLENRIAELAEHSKPFTVRTRGLGLFTGVSPVVYIPVIKDVRLAEFHRMVWEASYPTAIGASPYYAPDAWMPHITLAHGDVDWPKLACAMEKLASQTFDWEVRLDNLALVYQYSGEVGKIQNKIPFEGEIEANE